MAPVDASSTARGSKLCKEGVHVRQRRKDSSGHFRWRACMEGKNELVKISPKRTHHVRFGEDDMDKVIDWKERRQTTGKFEWGRGAVLEADAVYLTMWDLSMLLCVLWDLSTFLEILCIESSDAVYLTMWDLSMLLCVLWDLSAILCTCAHSWRSYDLSVFLLDLCTGSQFQEDLCSCLFQEDVPVFLRDLSPATRQENIGLDSQSVIRTPDADP
ncbi:hypothetical protein Bbelb_246370 [Branchiostoma belcheri]|nr:hypothetical protein Bbelb_246370 [Branchiostoma belcheri]